MKLLKLAVLGVSGMLGNAAFRILSARHPGSVYGTTRSNVAPDTFEPGLGRQIVTGIEVEDFDALVGFLGEIGPT